MKYIIIFIFSSSLFCSEYKLILNSYHNPNRIVFRLSNNKIECSLLGVAVPFYGNDNKCLSESFRKMSNLSIGFFENNMDLEQMYSVTITNGFCIVKYKNKILNEELIKNGYGVVNSYGVLDSRLLDKLLFLQDLAIKNKSGLWNSFYDEMECFSNSY